MEMVKQTRRRRKKGEVLTFDVSARHAFLTGFRKRKQERRKKAMLEAMERERKEKIDIRKEIRDDVKQRWKDAQAADRRVLKLLDKIHTPAALQERESNRNEEKPVGETLVIVGFDREEDDPFGDCDVTTTDLSSISGGNLWPDLTAPQGSNGILCRVEHEGALARRRTGENWEEHLQRRSKNLALEEVRRKKAMARQLEKRIVEKGRQGRKKPCGQKKKGHKNGKSTARQRRKRK